MWREEASRVILEGFLEGGFISTSPGSWWVPSPVIALKSSVCCNGVAGTGQVIAPLPVTHFTLQLSLTSGMGGNSRVPSGALKYSFCLHSYFLKGQQLLKVKTFV